MADSKTATSDSETATGDSKTATGDSETATGDSETATGDSKTATGGRQERGRLFYASMANGARRVGDSLNLLYHYLLIVICYLPGGPA
jgi:hypothetical protein